MHLSRHPKWRESRSLSFFLLWMALLHCSGHCAIVAVGEAVETQVLVASSDKPVIDIPKCDMCTTPACIHSASQVLTNIDESVNPCEDFYKFACGGFIKNTVIPDDDVEMNPTTIAWYKIRDQLKINVEEPILPKEPKPFKFIKDFYKSCINVSETDPQEYSAMLAILKELGGWPVLDGKTWTEDTFDWLQSISKFKDIGYSTGVFFNIVIDLYPNTTTRVLKLVPAGLGLPRIYLEKGLNDNITKIYYDHIVNVAVTLGADREFAKEELLRALKFEIELSNLTSPIETVKNSSLRFDPTTITNLTNSYPGIPWRDYITNRLPTSLKINDSEVVIVNDPVFFKRLGALLAATPKRDQSNYVLWRAVDESSEYFGGEIAKLRSKFLADVFGSPRSTSKPSKCLDNTVSNFPIAIGAFYVHKHFPNTAKRTVIEMVDNIKEQFNQMLARADWMDNKTRKYALQKLASMIIKIAYPDELVNDSKLEDIYRGLEINNSSYFQANLNLTLFSREHWFGKLREPANTSDWVRVVHVNAYYTPLENSIEFPAGILQGAFFHNDRPKYLNYGALGRIIGHEIAHGFDPQGRNYDKKGRVFDWWAEATSAEYLKKVRCIIDQYGNYSVAEGLNVNGTTTQGENVADNVGIKAAYLAYKDWVERNGKELRLPGLKYDPQQMFWMSAVSGWCSVLRPDAVEFDATYDEHSPGRFRALGTFSNMPEFAEDFNCPLGSPMNPKEKCLLW